MGTLYWGGGEISKWEMGIIIIYITKMGIMLQKWGVSNASKNCFECHGYQYAISQTQKLKITGNQKKRKTNKENRIRTGKKKN